MTERLIEAIDESDKGLTPPPFGKLEIMIEGAPASVQSTKSVRDAYLAKIKGKLSKFCFILTGQIMLEIVWLTPAKSRYETDAKADIDNCLKPIIDAFTGPDGLFINDCQLKGLYICWRHIESAEERLLFNFEFDADQWCEKKGLAFIKFDRGLCSPVNTTWSKSLRCAWVKAISTAEHFQKNLQLMEVPYLELAGMVGGSQPFHITRTIGFPVFSIEQFVSEED